MYQLKQGLKSRATAITQSNNQSSRSHSVFQIVLERSGVISKLRIVDLAGSEKYSFRHDMPAAEKAVKAKEVAFINSSLSTLGLCISALADTTKRPPHVPYRNSKLTRVLRDSLDESSNVAMIICVSASRSHVSETLSTLQFANRAKRAVLPQHPPNFDSPRIMPTEDLLKAYEEEKARRIDLQEYIQKSVVKEMEELRLENQRLIARIRELSCPA